MMGIIQRGSDYFGYYYNIKLGKSGLSLRFDTNGIDLGLGISLNWKGGTWINIKLFNSAATFYFRPDWE